MAILFVTLTLVPVEGSKTIVVPNVITLTTIIESSLLLLLF